MRYHKTLLVWTMKVDKFKVAAESDKKQIVSNDSQELVQKLKIEHSAME
jgi:hypothetical protein